MTGGTGVESFSGSALTDPRTLNLAKRVTIREDPDMTARLPDLRPASVTVGMKDGTRFRASVETNRGDWQDPYSKEQLSGKFMSLATRLWSEELCKNISNQIMNIEQLSDMNDLFSITSMNASVNSSPASGPKG